MVWSTAPHPVIAEALGDLPHGRALDLACGEGRHSLWLAQQGWQCLGVDFATIAIERATRRARQTGLQTQCVFRAEDLQTWRAAEAAYDLVLIAYLHTDSNTRAHWWPAALAAVRPGGTLCYLGHDRSNITDGIGGPQNPDVLPTLEDLRGHLNDWTVERAEIIERPAKDDPGHAPPTGTPGAMALDALLIARRPTP